MAERDRFELDLARALRAYAQDAPTQVRPAELARQFAAAYPHRRTMVGRWGFGPMPAVALILLLAGLVLALVFGLVSGAIRPDEAVLISPSPTSPTEVLSPTPAPSAGTVSLIKGTSTCHEGSQWVTYGRNTVIVEQLSCINSTNDERVSGWMVGDLTITVEPATATAGRWVGQLTLTNAGGTWTGQGWGATISWPQEDRAAGAALDYGENTYLGSGGYAGLVYHEFVARTGGALDLSGWIEPMR